MSGKSFTIYACLWFQSMNMFTNLSIAFKHTLMTQMNHRKRKRRPWREEIHYFVCQGRTSVPRRSYRKIPPSGKVWNPYWRRSSRLPRSCSRVPLCWDPRACWKRSPWQQEEPYRTQAHHPCCEEWWGVEQASWRSNHCFRRSSSQHSRSTSSQEDWKVKRLLFFFNSSCHAIWLSQTRQATKIYKQDFLKSAHGDKVQTTFCYFYFFACTALYYIYIYIICCFIKVVVVIDIVINNFKIPLLFKTTFDLKFDVSIFIFVPYFSSSVEVCPSSYRE